MLIGGRYRLLQLVGRGGMGRVWLARDELLHRDVAVKEVTPPDWLSDGEQDGLVARTMREARTAARLSHPNVVRVHDVVHVGATSWIVMEYVPSRSLQEVLRSGPLTSRRTAEIGLAVLAALRAAHRAGVLHRDVKPGNVLIAYDGRILLTDFGLATFDDGGSQLTRPGVIMGSPEYVAPERAAEGISSAETDLWSLGATLHAAVEGRSPYARPTAMATLTALATSPPDPAPHAGPLGPVLAGLLRRDPRWRLGVDEAERLLRSAADPTIGTDRRGAPTTGTDSAGSPVTGTASVRAHPRWRWWVPVLAAGLAVLAGFGTAAVATGDRVTSPMVSVGGPTATPAQSNDWPASREPEHRDGPGTDHQDQPPPPGPPGIPPPPFPCVRPGHPGRGVVAASQPPGEDFGPPARWTWYLDDSGFRIAVPIGWHYYREDGVSCFREPGSSRALSVDPSTRIIGDPAAQLRAEAQRDVDAGVLPSYQQIRITPTGDRRGAEWECRWTTPYGERMHSLRLLTGVTRSGAYTLGWVAPDLDWGGDTESLAAAWASFRPAA